MLTPPQPTKQKPDTTNIQEEVRALYDSNAPATTATPWTPSINFSALPASAPPFSASSLPPINQDMWRELQTQTQQQPITPSAWQLPAAAFASPQQTAPSASLPMQQSTTAEPQQTANLIDLDWNETTATTQAVQQPFYPQITQPEVDTELQAGFLAATDAEFDETLEAALSDVDSYDLNTLLTNFKQGFSVNYGSLTPAFQAKFESRAKRIIAEKLSAAQEEAALTIRPTTASLYPPLAPVEGYSERHYAAPAKIINTDEAFQAAELSLALDEFYLFADQPGTDRQLLLTAMDNLSEHYQQLTEASKFQFARSVELNARRQAAAREAAAAVIPEDETAQAALFSQATDEFDRYFEDPAYNKQTLVQDFAGFSSFYAELTPKLREDFARYVRQKAAQPTRALQPQQQQFAPMFSPATMSAQQRIHEQVTEQALFDKALVEFGNHVQTYAPETALTTFTGSNQTYKQLPPARQAEFQTIARLQLEVTDRPAQRQVAAARR